MNSFLFQLSREDLWRTFWSGNFSHSPGSRPDTYMPIVINSPITTDSRVVRVTAQSRSAKPYWRKACDLTACVPTGTIQLEIDRFFISLDQPKLIIMPQVAGAYSFKIRVPWWLEDLSIFLDEFTGVVDHSIEKAIREAKQEILNAI
jgi:hypothetical protein